MNRRSLLAGAASATIAALSGCLGLVGLDEHEASPAGVDPSALAETGYERTGVREHAVSEEVEMAFYSEEVAATNYLAEHEKAVDMGPLGRRRGAVFVVLTTPQVSVVGREFNPVEGMESGELVELVAESYDGVGDVSHVGDETVRILGQETTASRFEGVATFDGLDVDVSVHVSESVETERDHLVTVGVHPRALPVEGERVRALMEGVVEDVDADSRAVDGDDGELDDGAGGGGSDGDDGNGEDDGDGEGDGIGLGL